MVLRPRAQKPLGFSAAGMLLCFVIGFVIALWLRATYISLPDLFVRFGSSSFLNSEDSINSKQPRVLFLIRTYPKHYETRLKDVVTTYLTKVPSDQIMIVGNAPHVLSAPDGTIEGNPTAMRNINVLGTDGHDSLNGTVCMEDHGPGLTCKGGRALFYAYQKRESFDWLFVVDDDVYVHRHNVETTVAELDPLLPLVYTTPGCGPKVRCAVRAGGGICGGGGYLLSRQNLERAVLGDKEEANRTSHNLNIRTDEQELLSEWMKSVANIGRTVASDDGNWWDDITIGCVLHERACVTSQRLAGLHPWDMNATEIIHKLAHEWPLSFHYIDHGEMPGMQALHKLVTGTNRRSTANHRYKENVV